jgi:hypothetical protein
MFARHFDAATGAMFLSKVQIGLFSKEILNLGNEQNFLHRNMSNLGFQRAFIHASPRLAIAPYVLDFELNLADSELHM